MVRFVTLHIPTSCYSKVQPAIDNLLYIGKICQVVRFVGQSDITQIQFKTKDKYLQRILDDIQAQGVGKDFGQIDVTPLLLTKPALNFVDQREIEAEPTEKDGIELRHLSVSSTTSTSFSTGVKKKKRLYRIDDRMTVDEIDSFIDEGNHLTFNYLALLFCASLMAGTGLAEDSGTTIIAAMLVSPLMGPIISITFGCAVKEWEIIKRGIRNEVIGVCLSFSTGFFVGLISSGLYSPEYRSDQIVGRGEVMGLVSGAVVAFASGVAAVVAISMGGVGALVGVSISAALLAPVVNSGLCLALAFVYSMTDRTSYAKEYAVYSVISFALFFLNFVIMIASGFFTFRYIKNVRPSTLSKSHHEYHHFHHQHHMTSTASTNSTTSNSTTHSNSNITDHYPPVSSEMYSYNTRKSPFHSTSGDAGANDKNSESTD